MHFTHPWHLIVVRTRGLVFVRPEKSWRPIVTISVVQGKDEHGPSHEVALGCDGQNPNLKSVIPVNDVNPATRLVVQVFHKSQTKKKHRKRTLVGSASVSLAEFLNKHPLPHHRPVEYDIRLSCPPPQRKSPTVGGKQQYSATLTMRFIVPHAEPALNVSPPTTPVTDYPETDAIFSDGASSSKAMSDTMVQSTPAGTEDGTRPRWGKGPEIDRLDGSTGLRRRRKKPKGFHVFSDTDRCPDESSSEDYTPPPTPEEDYFPPMLADGRYGKPEFDGQDEVAFASPSLLPMHSDQVSVLSVEGSLSFAEACINRFAPYHDLREADKDGDVEKAAKVRAELLTEWYVVCASCLALASIDAAVFGFGPDSLFVLDGFSREVVSIGAIAAGIGFAVDTWFLFRYGGTNVEKFQQAAKDVYGSYFFFSLTCRLPIACMLLSALALMAFLLAVAWSAWPTAVLVMSFAAGVLLSSQFLVYGAHRFVNLLVWAVRVAWRRVFGSRVRVQALALAQGSQARRSGEGRVEMPVPCPSPAPANGAVVPRMEMRFAERYERSCEGT